ncbi:MAG TPA: hypothetical protein VGG28_20230 [Kofleriaceae bacterium]|jgi:hypothetical protein
MRAWLVVVVAFAACGDSGDPGAYCMTDSDCSGGNVCARDESCWPSNELYTVKVTWTIAGSAAGSASCAPFPDFNVNFYSDEEEFGFAPVPCMAGEFPIDKLPTAYTEVEVADASYSIFDQTMNIDSDGSNGTAAFDLTP